MENTNVTQRITENLPGEIKKLRRFVLWKSELNEKGEPSKVPYSDIDKKTSANAKKHGHTWNTFQGVVDLFKKHPGHFSGIGIVLGDGLTGIDCDKVIDADGNLDAEARELLEIVPGYVETSPSGKGFHLLVWGALPKDRAGIKFEEKSKPKGEAKGFEFYDESSARYLTITGAVFEGRDKLNEGDASEQIAAAYWKIQKKYRPQKETRQQPSKEPVPIETARRVDSRWDYENDAELLDQARQAKNGQKFISLFDRGEITKTPSEARMALLPMLAYWTCKDEARMDRLFRQSALFDEKWDRPQNGKTLGAIEIRNACEFQVNIYEPKTSRVRSPLNFPSSSVDGDPAHTFGYYLNDSGNAQRLIDLHGGDIRYISSWDKWYAWTGAHWDADGYQVIASTLAGDVAVMLREQGEDAEEEATAILEELEAVGITMTSIKAGVCPPAVKEKVERFKSLLGMADSLKKFAVQSGNKQRVGGMVYMARSGESRTGKIAITHKDLDKDKYLFNCGNGTLNLHTGELQPFKREDFITRKISTEYHPTAKCPKWLDFLEKIFQKDEKIIDYVQTAAGYSLTGNVNESVIFLLHGGGRNGKSTFLEIIRRVLEDSYSGNVPVQVFKQKYGDGGENRELAMVSGARFVTAAEPATGMRLDESLVKSITGGDPISCRKMREDMWSYSPEFKVWLCMNQLPTIKGTDMGLWSRIRVIPFLYTIPKDERDPLFAEKLFNEEAEGVLSWLVEGALRYMKSGLTTPMAVEAAVEEYRQGEDVLGQFFGDCCSFGNNHFVNKNLLFEAYEKWAKENNETALTLTKFTREMKTRGYAVEPTSKMMDGKKENIKNFVGISLGGLPFDD